MTTPHYFTVDEANALLPQIEPLMAELLERRARVVRERDQVTAVVSDGRSDVGSAAASALVREFIRIEALIDEIRAFGCQLKDINVGLLDFLAEIDGREVYLCWRYGESRIAYYHELHTGFAGRKAI